ncbi:hypothetical protein JG687_00007582 [Phytophthora cactorum]|uniref:Uncharacterized protein n=1 Tax=Phytophthora cactorum TaxID=29920 RepID=A0A8T1UJB2_9STRA|nr:hypothetical protein GQ600_19676 [Phytophthora cactorum]KAG6961674.1 hypothetical protein JG687_00007582 [Phytophthora cactorum]
MGAGESVTSRDVVGGLSSHWTISAALNRSALRANNYTDKHRESVISIAEMFAISMLKNKLPHT